MNPLDPFGLISRLIDFGSNQTPYNNYSNQMQQLAKELAPYYNMGQASMGRYNQITNNLLDNPGFLENKLASSFKNSPYQQKILENTQRMMNNNAAQTGLLGSTAQQSQVQNNLAEDQNQFMNQYIDRGMGEYNHALSGQADIGHSGLQALLDALNYQQQGYNAQMAGGMQRNNFIKQLLGDAFGIGSAVALG